MPGAGERKKEGLLFNGFRVLVVDDKKILSIDGGDGYTSPNVFNATELYTYEGLSVSINIVLCIFYQNTFFFV